MLPAALALILAQTLPQPTGPDRVGTFVVHLFDEARGNRPIVGQVWYPAGIGAYPAPYAPDPGLVDAMLANGYIDDTAAMMAMRTVETHAWLEAAPAGRAHPVVTISPGFGISRVNMTSIAEDLASHGYVAITLDHAHGGFMVLPGSRVLSTADDSTRWNDEAFHAAQMNEWAADIAFVLTALQGAGSGKVAALARTMDFSRIAAIGHSSGGLAAVEACNRDARLIACVNMDGGATSPAGTPIVDFARTGVRKPTLLLRSDPIYSDSDLARRGRTRAQWDEGRTRTLAALQRLADSSSVPIVEARVAGTGHMSFTDAPFIMPTMITRFGGRIIEPERGYAVITAALRAWLDQQLGRGGSFDPVAAGLPELRVLRLEKR